MEFYDNIINQLLRICEELRAQQTKTKRLQEYLDAVHYNSNGSDNDSLSLTDDENNEDNF